jgi:xylose isomerase
MPEFFPQIKEPIPYEGPESQNPLAFKWYQPGLMVGDLSMAQHLRFAVAYWHTFKNLGRDIFGSEVFRRPWDASDDPMQRAKDAMRAAFEFCHKLGVEYYCFHDRDIAPEGESFSQSCRNLEKMVKLAKELQKDTGIKLLWGTANLFGHPRYAHGAASNPDLKVFAYAAAQVKHAIAATHELGGENYVFWGGREGYETLLNTDIRQEEEQLARFFHMAVDYAKAIGFSGPFLIEPKPKEPTKHQYDYDAASALNFLRAHDLMDSFKLNIEANHATLAGHTFEHELSVAGAVGKLGSIDINRGDPLLGWDTDQFPTDLYSTVYAMMVVLEQGGIGSGGLNFDAKVRRGSVDELDLFYAHIGGMDTFARGLLIAHKIQRDGLISGFIKKRYASFNQGLGARVMSGGSSFEELEAYVLENPEPQPMSGRQEYLENLVNSYI